jgi:hypothetical protein
MPHSHAPSGGSIPDHFILNPTWLAPVRLGKHRLFLRNPPVWSRGYAIRIWYQPTFRPSRRVFAQSGTNLLGRSQKPGVQELGEY